MPTGIYKRKPVSEEFRAKMSKIQQEEKGSNWKGDNVGYTATHDWVRKWKGKPTMCEGCGKDGLKKSQIHWANIDYQYRRILDDYIGLCVSCHKKYDYEHNLGKVNTKLLIKQGRTEINQTNQTNQL